MILYLDLIIISNFIVNFCFIETIYILFNEVIDYKKVFVSSIICIILLVSYLFDYIIFNIIKVIGGFLIIFLSFKYVSFKKYIIEVCLYYILNLTFIGILSIYNIKGCFIYIAILITSLLIIIYSNKKHIIKHTNYSIEFTINKKLYRLDALLDTGNNVSFLGKPIVFLDESFFDTSLKQVGMTSVETISNQEHIKCFIIKEFYIYEKNKKIKKDVYVAFAKLNNKQCLLNILLYS